MVLGAEQVVLWCPTLPQRLHLCRRGGALSQVPAERILLFLGRPACLTLTAGFMAPSGISCDLSSSLIPCALDSASEKHDELYRVQPVGQVQEVCEIVHVSCMVICSNGMEARLLMLLPFQA